MNNEEKILEMLEKHGKILEKMDQRMDRMDQRMGQMQEQLDRVDERSQRTADLLETVDERSQRTAVLMEADIMPKLQLLYEGHQGIVEKLKTLDEVKELAEDTRDKVGVIYAVVKQHSRDITELKRAQ